MRQGRAGAEEGAVGDAWWRQVGLHDWHRRWADRAAASGYEIGVDIGEAPELGLVDAGQNQAVRGVSAGAARVKNLSKFSPLRPHCGKHREGNMKSRTHAWLIHPLRGQRVVPGRGLTGRGLNGGKGISNRSSLSQSIQRKKPEHGWWASPSGPEPRRLAGAW